MQFDVQVLHLKPPIPCHLCRMGPASRGNGDVDAIAARRPGPSGPKALRSNAEPRDLGHHGGRGKSKKTRGRNREYNWC